MAASPPQRVFQAKDRREIFLAVVAGLAVLALLIYGMLNLGNHAAASSITGRIVGKNFTPLDEERITLGAGGVRKSEVKGKFVIQVKSDADGELYNVWLDEGTYGRLHLGDPYQIPRSALAGD